MGACFSLCESPQSRFPTFLDQTALHNQSGKFVIEFISAFDVPKADLTSESDPFVRACLILREGNNDVRISRIVQTIFQEDTKTPIWNSYHNFFVNPPLHAELYLEIFDKDHTNEDDLVGYARIPFSKLLTEDVQIFKLSFIGIGSPSLNPNFSISLRRLFIHHDPPIERTIFFIRHGESKWNEAEKNLAVRGMIAHDHALTRVGIQQAEELNEKWRAFQLTMGEDLQTLSPFSPPPSITKTSTFNTTPNSNNNNNNNNNTDSTQQDEADGVDSNLKRYLETQFILCRHTLASPLTRAFQTALVAMSTHPGAVERGIRLYSNIREIKNVAGMDCVGVAKGKKEILNRVKEELRLELGEEMLTYYTPSTNHTSGPDGLSSLISPLSLPSTPSLSLKESLFSTSHKTPSHLSPDTPIISSLSTPLDDSTSSLLPPQPPSSPSSSPFSSQQQSQSHSLSKVDFYFSSPLSCGSIEEGDTSNQWWTPQNESDQKERQRERVMETMRFLRYYSPSPPSTSSCYSSTSPSVSFSSSSSVSVLTPKSAPFSPTSSSYSSFNNNNHNNNNHNQEQNQHQHPHKGREEADPIVCVCHSLFIRAFLALHLPSSPSFLSNQPSLANQVGKKKLDNASLIGLRVRFKEDSDENTEILFAELLFGSKFSDSKHGGHGGGKEKDLSSSSSKKKNKGEREDDEEIDDEIN